MVPIEKIENDENEHIEDDGEKECNQVMIEDIVKETAKDESVDGQQSSR